MFATVPGDMKKEEGIDYTSCPLCFTKEQGLIHMYTHTNTHIHVYMYISIIYNTSNIYNGYWILFEQVLGLKVTHYEEYCLLLFSM